MYSQNKTKVGLKERPNTCHSPLHQSQNKTKVGLKASVTHVEDGQNNGQNKTKVGLKDREDLQLREWGKKSE